MRYLIVVLVLFLLNPSGQCEPLTTQSKADLRIFFKSIKNTLPYAKKCLRLLRLANSEKYGDCIQYKKLMTDVTNQLVKIKRIENDEQKQFEITYNDLLYDNFEEYNILTTLNYVIKKRLNNE